MAIAWAIGVPDKFQDLGYSEVPPDNTIREIFEEGPPQTRQISTSNPTKVRLSFEFENSEKLLFMAWYNVALGFGSLSFETVDYANDSQLHTFKFSAVPTLFYLSASKWKISCEWDRLD